MMIRHFLFSMKKSYALIKLGCRRLSRRKNSFEISNNYSPSLNGIILTAKYCWLPLTRQCLTSPSAPLDFWVIKCKKLLNLIFLFSFTYPSFSRQVYFSSKSLLDYIEGITLGFLLGIEIFKEECEELFLLDTGEKI